MKTQSQIAWITGATGETRTYRTMVVGWQNSVAALNAQIAAYNRESLKSEKRKTVNPHHGMGEIAIKKQIIASLRELKCRLDDWATKLRGLRFDTTRIEGKKRELRSVLRQTEKLKDVRNTAFHYGDFLESPESLIKIYTEVESWDDEKLNAILDALHQLGDVMKLEVLSKC